MGATRMLNGRWRIILGHGTDRRYAYYDSWEEAEKAIRCERMEAKVRDVKRRWAQEPETEKQREQKPKSLRTEKQKTEKQTFENESYRK